MRVLCGVLCVVNVNSEQGSRLVDRSAIRMRHWRQGSEKAPMIVMVSTGTNGRILLFGCRKLPIDQPSESTYCDTILPKGYLYCFTQRLSLPKGYLFDTILPKGWHHFTPFYPKVISTQRLSLYTILPKGYLYTILPKGYLYCPVISIVACCHSVKLCALAARAVRPQHHENCG